jgi:hypothetical protein
MLVHFNVLFFLLIISIFPDSHQDQRIRSLENIQGNLKSEINSLRKEILEYQNQIKNGDTDPLDEIKKYSISDSNDSIKSLESTNFGNRYAIVIGINHFEDNGIQDLPKARNDAKIFGKILRSQGQFDYVFIMTDDIDPEHDHDRLYPSKFNIRDKFKALLNISKPDDLFVVFYSGHAVSDIDENTYFFAADTDLNNQYSSSISFNDLVDQFKSKNLRKTILFMDAFREELYTDGNTPHNEAVIQDDPGIAAKIFSAFPGYKSYEDFSTDYGVFTKNLVVGLEGDADLNEDGVVTVLELINFTQRTIKGWSIKNNRYQKPYIKLHGSKTKDLVISIALHKKNSYVEEKAPRMVYESDILLRSAILPGWGQYYASQREKGIAIMSTWGGLLSYYLYNYQRFTILQERYMDYNTYPGSSIYEYSIWNLDNLKSEVREAETRSNDALGILIGYWLVNMIDAKYFTALPNNDYLGFGISLRNLFDSNGSRIIPEQYGTIYFRNTY